MTGQLARRGPLLYGVLALAGVALLLPTALRPPPDSTNQSSQFSPDAPPDKNADAIIRSVQLGGSSSTAGQPPRVVVTPPPLATPPPPPGPRLPSRAGCFPGTPPKQIESVYSVPCRPVFRGDNGGATAPGVTRTDINVIFHTTADYGNEFKVPKEITDANQGDGTQSRTLNDLKKYFNKHFELYGRQLRFFSSPATQFGASESDQIAAAERAIAFAKPFTGVVSTTAPNAETFTKHKIFHWNYDNLSEKWHRKQAPYSWTATVTGEVTAGLFGEYLCKQLKGHKPHPTGDTSNGINFDPNAPRKFGVIETNEVNSESHAKLYAGMATCGENPQPDVQTYFSDVQDVDTTIAQMKANKISSVIFNNDIFSAILYMQSAENQQYRPEWISTGWGALDLTTLNRQMPPLQSRNLFGISIGEIVRDPRLNECLRAVRSVDPGFTGDIGACGTLWAPLVHMVDAMQLVGPRLTREAMAAAIPAIPHLDPDPTRLWALSGGYRTDKHSYADAATIFWWDNAARDPDGNTGSYRYADCARRYRPGQFERVPRAFAQQGSVTGFTWTRCSTV